MRHSPTDALPPRPTPRPRPGPIVVALVGVAVVAALLAACGGPSGHVAGPVLECVALDYPCSFAEMDVATIARSIALADDVDALFANGGTVSDALDLMSRQPDVAFAGTDGHAVLFRLVGGGPVVVDPTLDPVTPVAPEGLVERGGVRTDAAPSVAVDAIAPAAVVGGPGGQKRALVLSPFQHDFAFDTGNAVATLLAETPGYEGGVTFRATVSPDDPVVTVDDFLELDAYDVVYVSTHGGALCLDAELGEVGDSGYPGSVVTGTTGRCRSDFLVQRFHGTPADLQSLGHVGVVLYRGSQHFSIAITADFIRHYYPNGLANQVAVLLACSTFSRSFSESIAGGLGVFVSWDRPVHEDTALVTLQMMQLLAQDGLTVGEALAELGPLTVDEITGARLRTTGATAVGDLRIRDVVAARDAVGGDDLRTAVEIELDGVPDDGEPDRLELDVRVLGVTEATIAGYGLEVEVNGVRRASVSPASRGAWIGPFEVRVPVTVDLGFDAAAGESLDIVVTAYLPEGGVSQVTGRPRVAGAAGERITGRLEWSYEGFDWDQTAVADVTFVRHPEQAWDDPVQTFVLEGGTMSFTTMGTDARRCVVHGTASRTLLPSQSTTIEIDHRTDPPRVRGWGNSVTEPLVASVTCPDGTAGTQEISTNVVILNIPSAAGHALDGGTIVGSYGQARTTWDWALELR